MILVGIDIGGTFTDLVVLADGRLTSVKVASTPSDFGEGFARALDACGSDPSQIDTIVHGTTVATNALIERKGAVCGLITTRGFRDILALRRRNRRRPAGLETAFDPLIPRHLRLEVDERTGADGPIEEPAADAACEAASHLWAAGAEAIVVSYLHAAEHPEHERATASCLRERFPGRRILAATEVTAAPDEFERTATASAAAFVTPLMEGYVASLASRLKERRCPADFQIVASDGGLIPASEAPSRALRTALSGPAAGVWGMGKLCSSLGIAHFVAADMGGTSFDVSLVTDDSPALTRCREIGFGLPMAIPCVDITTIGAGGGSIARVDAWGSVEVGPDGTGADPGPACYGKQSHDPTVTDADLVLGRIGGALRLPSENRALDAEAAARVLHDRVARSLGLTVEAAAAAVLDALHEKASEAIRVLAMEKQVSLDDVVLAAYGGAGPLHGVELARRLGIGQVIVPPRAGLFSAVGGLMVGRRETRWRQLQVPVDAAGLRDLDRVRRELIEEAKAALGQAASLVLFEADVGYAGQPNGTGVALAETMTAAGIRSAFERRYGVYGTPLDLPLTIRSVQVTAAVETDAGRIGTVLEAIRPPGGNGEPVGRRPVRFGGVPVDCGVFDRDVLKVGATLAGPAVIEEAGATTLLPPGASAGMDDLGVLHIAVGDAGNGGGLYGGGHV